MKNFRKTNPVDRQVGTARIEVDGQDRYLIDKSGRKVAKLTNGSWVPLIPGVEVTVVDDVLMGITYHVHETAAQDIMKEMLRPEGCHDLDKEIEAALQRAIADSGQTLNENQKNNLRIRMTASAKRKVAEILEKCEVARAH